MPSYSEKQILALAPDQSSQKSGAELAAARKWVSLGNDARAAWGECQGSGKLPYQTCIDLSEPAFKCTCPSRKFPCKHGLGLFLLVAKEPAAFAQGSPPAWVTEWLSGRQQRAEKKTKSRDDAAAEISDRAAQARRQAERQAKIESGLSQLERWLQDRMRQGLAGLQLQSYSFWEEVAARLVDAQAPGVARLIRQCAELASGGDGWQERLFDRFGQIYLLIEAFKRLDQLSPETQSDVRAAIGITVSQEDLLKEQGVRDLWLIMAQRVNQEDRLKVQRTWLRGQHTARWALVLSFAHGMQPLDVSLVPGFTLEAELVFFPGAHQLRALVKSRGNSWQTLTDIQVSEDSEQALDEYSAAIARNPWLETCPMAINQVVPIRDKAAGWFLQDQIKNLIPLTVAGNVGWQMMAISGGRPLSVVGEYDGCAFLPLSAVTGDQYFRLDERG